MGVDVISNRLVRYWLRETSLSIFFVTLADGNGGSLSSLPSACQRAYSWTKSSTLIFEILLGGSTRSMSATIHIVSLSAIDLNYASKTEQR